LTLEAVRNSQARNARANNGNLFVLQDVVLCGV